MADTTEPARKTTRLRKTASVSLSAADETISVPMTSHKANPIVSAFEKTIEDLTRSKEEFERLEKEIAETKAAWIKEQKAHDEEINQHKAQEEIARRREKETYEYETQLARKRSQDEFEEKKSSGEKELATQKDQIDSDRKELAELRKQVENFPAEKDKAVKEAVMTAEKSLREQFDQERKLSEQQNKASTDVLNLKIANLETENSRQQKENESLKKTLEDVTTQFREVAVKAIESNRPEIRPTNN